ncbi:MAG TPA: transglycosylase SLT domain-containing protein [Crinalium sp.]
MLKRYKRELFIATGAGTLALVLGASAATLHSSGALFDLPLVGTWMRSPHSSSPPDALNLEPDASSTVLPLATLPSGERAEKLQAIAKDAPSLDQNRARYLLAIDLINQNRGGAALPLLQKLEQSYPVLAPYILVKRAQAYTASNQPQQANATWQQIVQQYPDHPIAAEALYALGKTNPQYWDQILQNFPAHPHAIEIAETRLAQNPNQPTLLLLLAKHGLYLKDIDLVLDRLVNDYSAQLTPEDWEAIAFGYWENQRYGSAGRAYGRSPQTPLNMYRTGRGAQLGKRTEDAIAAYQTLIQTFPDAPETGLALVRLGKLTKPTEAIAYLDQAINRFPDRAAEALLERAKILDELGSPQSASQARQSILTQYSKSDTAAELRWTLTEQRMQAGDFQSAWNLAQQIVKENPTSEYAPEAAFWIGKWQQQAGRTQEAKTAFEYVLMHYPESYYAWRSAVYLGWNVGDFTTVRQNLPQVVKPSQRSRLPAGSDTLRELYQLGQDADAWALWQTEFKNVRQPTVAEQFTDGLMRLGVGDNLDGIFMLSSLSNRELPKEKEEYASLKQQAGYWQSLYPFPFLNSIEQWSQQRQLNPLLVTALIRQESRFEPKIQSSAGAVGLMQVMPDTADWIAEQINLTDFDLNKPDDNLKLGTWYLNYTHEEYSNNSLFAVASYNAGPGNVADWIDRFGFSDPDLFVEQIPFPETKGYVESVFANYWNYLRLYNPEVSQQLARYSPNHATVSQKP